MEGRTISIARSTNTLPAVLAPATGGTGRGERVTPGGQVTLAGEGDPRPAHALVAARLADGEDAGPPPLGQVVVQVGAPPLGRSGEVIGACVAVLVEGSADGRPGQVADQRIHLPSLTDRGGMWFSRLY